MPSIRWFWKAFSANDRQLFAVRERSRWKRLLDRFASLSHDSRPFIVHIYNVGRHNHFQVTNSIDGCESTLYSKHHMWVSHFDSPFEMHLSKDVLRISIVIHNTVDVIDMDQHVCDSAGDSVGNNK